MAFNIKNVLTEDELRITKKMRDNGAYDWTRKRKSGEEDYSLSMDKVVKGLEKGMTRQEIADELCKRKGQILYMEDLLMERLEHPTLTKKEQEREGGIVILDKKQVELIQVKKEIEQ